MSEDYRAPTAAERRFLELVTAGYDEFAAQVATCEIVAAGPAGPFEIRARPGAPSSPSSRVPGPSLELGRATDELAPYIETSESGKATIETSIYTDAAGMLARVEIAVLGDAEILDLCGLFIAASQADPPLLIAPPGHAPQRTYRTPTANELAFLRIATRHDPELRMQIETCEIADYDLTGWCYVRVSAGPPCRCEGPVQGPRLMVEASEIVISASVLRFVNSSGEHGEVHSDALPAMERTLVELLLRRDENGMLSSIEVVFYGFGQLVNAYDVFVAADAADPARLTYVVDTH